MHGAVRTWIQRRTVQVTVACNNSTLVRTALVRDTLSRSGTTPRVVAYGRDRNVKGVTEHPTVQRCVSYYSYYKQWDGSVLCIEEGGKKRAKELLRTSTRYSGCCLKLTTPPEKAETAEGCRSLAESKIPSSRASGESVLGEGRAPLVGTQSND
jgi:hypothetical protein